MTPEFPDSSLSPSIQPVTLATGSLAEGVDPAGSDLTQEKGHPPGLTEAGEELKPPENFFLPSVTQKTE